MDGKVAFITGGGRGQGRSHALRLAAEGARIVICDLGHDVDACPYPLSTEADMAETVRLVEERDQRCLSAIADVRDEAALTTLAERAMSEFGRIDVVCANAGIASIGSYDIPAEHWDQVLDINLKGVWLACKAAIPHMIAGGQGGSIVMTSSAAGLNPFYNFMAYTAAKHGVIGLMRSLAAELAPHSIRVNAICPTMVNTGMIRNEAIQNLFAGKESGATPEDIEFPAKTLNLLPVSLIEAVDLSNAVLYLSSEEGRYVTGVALPVDAGSTIQPAGIPPWSFEALMGG
ncbi:MAG TPA: mycofactocin-coupled SDR family oxidoreductase [Solirubrobacteraceae bacterium]|jgi:(+)-trans-carveol dehydrogenase|nr:mycofactocin-coupled SDR family oxidoreductase [Solirubrobacteraceae bacterium]